MFGRRAKNQEEQAGQENRDQPEQEVDVDRVLEDDICAVEEAVDRYLGNVTDELRQELLSTLESLDEQTALGDAFHGRRGVPFQLSPSVVGATSYSPIAEEVPSPEFEAQVALVKAAKQEVLRHSPETLAELSSAAAAVAAFHS
jgi:hypothetical protein